MRRKLYDELSLWKNHRKRQPLIVSGARQVGKTYLLKQFGQKEFDRFYHFDFEKSGVSLNPLFDGELDPKEIVTNLSLFVGEQIENRNSLIIFDEIQNCPRALTSLKYFSEELPQQAVCAAGSLLGTMLTGESFPVGKVVFLDLYPMNFEEFLDNSGVNMLYEAFDDLLSKKRSPPIVHQKLWDVLKQYYVVGGMPKAVQTYIDHKENKMHAFSEARTVQSALLDTYVRDFNKHAGKENAVHLSSVFENIPQQLSTIIDGSVKRYRFSGVIPGKRRFAELQGTIDWLIKSGLVLKVHICTKAELPLKAFAKQNIFKLFVFDVGLLGCMLELAPGTLFLQQFGQTKGFFAENFVSCELAAAGESSLYAWSGRNSEIEFLKDCEGRIVPIEVKSGLRTKAQSLRFYIDKYDPRLAIKITANPLCIGDGVLKNVPLYCAGRLPSQMPALLSS